MKSEPFFFLTGLQNHDWWNLIGVSALPHEVVNAEQGVGEEENGILLLKDHTPALFPREDAATQRTCRSFPSSGGWSSTEALSGPGLARTKPPSAQNRGEILDHMGQVMQSHWELGVTELELPGARRGPLGHHWGQWQLGPSCTVAIIDTS